MGINFSKIGEIAAMTGESCIKRIPHTNPINNNTNGLNALTKDVFEHSNQFFVKMSDGEKKLLPKELHNTKVGEAFASKIPEMQDKDYEQMFIFDQKGAFIARDKPPEVLNEAGELVERDRSHDKMSCCLSDYDDIMKVQELAEAKSYMGMIHYHPWEITFSGADIDLFRKHNYTTMMAKTPNGYAFLSKKSPEQKIDAELVNKYVYNEEQVEKKLVNSSKSNMEAIQRIDEFRNEQLKRFAEKGNLHYEYKAGDIKAESSNRNIPDVKSMYPSTEDQLKEIDGLTEYGWTKEQIKATKAAILELDAAPIENFYL